MPGYSSSSRQLSPSGTLRGLQQTCLPAVQRASLANHKLGWGEGRGQNLSFYDIPTVKDPECSLYFGRILSPVGAFEGGYVWFFQIHFLSIYCFGCVDFIALKGLTLVNIPDARRWEYLFGLLQEVAYTSKNTRCP